jgi:pyruvate/2-oxoglutarate dehydrogenase complex dihydrolipoamide acyltransferase (E2) component
MVFEFKLPDVGEGIHEGEIVKWHVKAGDPVKEDQLIVEVMTDKATVEITSPKAGRIGSINAKEGQVVKVGDVIVTIEEGAAGAKPAAHAAAPKHEAATKQEAQKAEAKEEKTLFDLPKDLGGVNPFKKKPADGAPAHAPQPAAARPAASTAVTHPAGRPLAAPAVRRRAREMGVDLAHVQGSGPVGRITSQDLQAFTSRGEGPRPAATPSPPVVTATQAMGPLTITPQGPVETIPMKGLRKRIAENMTRSKHIAAHYTYVEEVDATELVKLRDAAQPLAEQRGVKLTFLPFVFKAAVAALKAYPIVNSSYDESKQELVFKKYYHLGFAAATEEGLIVPVVKNVDKKSIFEIAKEIESLAEKVRNKKAAPDDLSGSTFTVTSLGKLGGVLATPIINYPEVAIMGVHAIKDRGVVRNGAVVPGKVMNLSFSFDHRIVDGAVGAQFAATLIRFLEDPKLLLLETA